MRAVVAAKPTVASMAAGVAPTPRRASASAKAPGATNRCTWYMWMAWPPDGARRRRSSGGVMLTHIQPTATGAPCPPAHTMAPSGTMATPPTSSTRLNCSGTSGRTSPGGSRRNAPT